ncbi:hypothetical protein DFH07DRAFT_950420 [Mycena maculata]|uniref:Uncharacterized protein n=1 Tax=Mycena maculata TaxID=230809 RepID=A0AAD7K8Y7_9AGAR|nr:hypothetical protein DFH07DRAFT_950420 [Mycena maculata]
MFYSPPVASSLLTKLPQAGRCTRQCAEDTPRVFVFGASIHVLGLPHPLRPRHPAPQAPLRRGVALRRPRLVTLYANMVFAQIAVAVVSLHIVVVELALMAIEAN